MSSNADEILKLSPVIPVIVLDKAEDAVPLARALIEGGIRVLEITLRTDAAMEAVEAVRESVEEAVVGVGTVTLKSQLRAAARQGAQFAISPGLTPALMGAAEAETEKMPFIPGISTVSELMLGFEAGLDRFKFFPAEAAGGPAMLKAFAGPFPEVKFCPTGGVNAGNFQDYLALPNVLCVGGSWVVPADRIAAGDWPAITRLAREAVEKTQQTTENTERTEG